MLLYVITIFILLSIYNLWWKRRKYPPGPVPLPVFGNLLEISRKPPGYDVYMKWRKDYGSIYTFWMGEKPVVAIAEYDLLRRTIIDDGDNYTDRDFFNEFYSIVRGGEGITTMEGSDWRIHRRFFLKALRQLGVGKDKFEEMILKEEDYMFDGIDKEIRTNEDINISGHIDSCVGSVINSLLFGYSFNENKNEFTELKNLITEYMGLVGRPALQFVMSYPNLSRRLPYFSGKEELKDST